MISAELKARFDCDEEVGNLNEYVRCKFEIEHWLLYLCAATYCPESSMKEIESFFPEAFGILGHTSLLQDPDGCWRYCRDFLQKIQKFPCVPTTTKQDHKNHKSLQTCWEKFDCWRKKKYLRIVQDNFKYPPTQPQPMAHPFVWCTLVEWNEIF